MVSRKKLSMRTARQANVIEYGHDSVTGGRRTLVLSLFLGTCAVFWGISFFMFPVLLISGDAGTLSLSLHRGNLFVIYANLGPPKPTLMLRKLTAPSALELHERIMSKRKVNLLLLEVSWERGPTAIACRISFVIVAISILIFWISSSAVRRRRWRRRTQFEGHR